MTDQPRRVSAGRALPATAASRPRSTSAGVDTSVKAPTRRTPPGAKARPRLHPRSAPQAYVLAGLAVVVAAFWFMNRGQAPPAESMAKALAAAAAAAPAPAPAPAADADAEPAVADRVVPAPASAATARPQSFEAAPPAPAAQPSTAPTASASLEDVIGRAMPAVVRVESGGSFGTGFSWRPTRSSPTCTW